MEATRANTPPEWDSHCEYGCDGLCGDLDHWRDRASYWYTVSESWREQVPGQDPSPLWKDEETAI